MYLFVVFNSNATAKPVRLSNQLFEKIPNPSITAAITIPKYHIIYFAFIVCPFSALVDACGQHLNEPLLTAISYIVFFD